MSLPGLDKESTGESRQDVRLHAQLLDPNDPQFAEWLIARQELMDDKGWVAPNGEYDRYDDNVHTKHIVLYDQAGKLTFGMRLTPVESYNQTLSWEMVRPSNIHAQVELEGQVDPLRPVWDLTRLTPGRDVPYRLKTRAIPQLFGEGLRQCIAEGDTDPIWIFTLDPAVMHWLEKQDVPVTILGQAILPGDTVSSMFGFVQPAPFIEQSLLLNDGSKANIFARRVTESDEA